MDRLIVEEDVGVEGFQDLALLDAAQEEGLVDPDVPCPQGADYSFMGRGASCRDEGGADGAGLLRIAVLNDGDRFQQLGEEPLREGFLRVFPLVFRESFKALLLKDPFCFVREEDGVPVKCNPNLRRFLRGIDRRI